MDTLFKIIIYGELTPNPFTFLSVFRHFEKQCALKEIKLVKFLSIKKID